VLTVFAISSGVVLDTIASVLVAAVDARAMHAWAAQAFVYV